MSSDPTQPTTEPGAPADVDQAAVPPSTLPPAPVPNPDPSGGTGGGWAITGRPASGPWSFHEHRLFEQACIKFGWGNWKKIQDDVPGRTKDQCKSHAQKFLKQNPHVKEQLLVEHRKLMAAKKSQDTKSPQKTVAKSTSGSWGGKTGSSSTEKVNAGSTDAVSYNLQEIEGEP